MPEQPIKRKRGAPLGNQNARKHGFYSNSLDKSEKRNLKHAQTVKGLDEEIDLLRVKIKSVVENDPDNVRLIAQAAISLGRLLRTRDRLAKNSPDSWHQAFENVIRDIAIPLGFDPVKYMQQKMDGVENPNGFQKFSNK